MRSTRSTMASSRSTTPIRRGASSSMRVMVSLNRASVASRPLVDLLRSVSVSPRSPSSASTCSTVTSAFSAACVSVLMRCRAGACLRAAVGLVCHGSQYAGCYSVRRGGFVEEPHRGVAADGTRRGHVVGGRAADGGGDRLGLLRAGDHQPHLAGPGDGGQRQGDAPRRRLGGVGDADDQPLGLAGGRGVREQRVDVPFTAHAEQVHVEVRRGRAVGGVGGQHLLVGQRGGVDVVAELAVAGGHRVHVGRRDRRCGPAALRGPACRCARRRRRARSARRPSTGAPSTSRSPRRGRRGA